jgi:hypothetical protein
VDISLPRLTIRGILDVNQQQPGHSGVPAATTTQTLDEYVSTSQTKQHVNHYQVAVGAALSGVSSKLEHAVLCAHRSTSVPQVFARLNLVLLQARRTTSLKPLLLIDNDAMIVVEYGAAQ